MSRSLSARKNAARSRFARRRRALALVLTFLTALAGPVSLAFAQSPNGDQTAAHAPAFDKTASNSEIFVIYRDEDGESACRVATPEERVRLSKTDQAGPARTIYSGGRRPDPDGGGEVLGPNATETGTPLLPSAGLRIVLHSTEQLQNNPTARDAFIVAANRWEALVSTPITIVLDVDFGTTFFGQPWQSQGILGATGTSTQTSQFSNVRQQLIANAPEAEELQLYNALPGGSIPVELNGSTASATNMRLTFTVARALGLRPDITNPDAIPLRQGDAGIGFNSAHPFDFNPEDGITPGTLDFDAVVVHEIGHALGFSSNSGNNVSTPLTVWDLFRFRPGAANAATFGTAPRLMTEGGTQVFFNNRVNSFGTTELQLSTGGGDGVGGDGEQSSHWKDDRFTPFIGIMDPRLPSGRREIITDNDLKALDAFGYKIGGTAPPPPPPSTPPNDNFANAVVLNGSSGSVTGTNTGATGEAGEPDHAGVTGTGRRSVWYSWTASAGGQTTFNTSGSNYDTVLGVYTGGAVGALTLIGSNDDVQSGVIIHSTVTFNALAGTTYRIAVDGFRSETGSVTLNWTAPPAPASYSISGRVTDGAGGGIDGATVSLAGPQSGQTTTDAAGNYAFNNLPAGNYILSPSKAGQFVGFAQSVDNLNSNRAVELFLIPFINVSGQIRDSQGAVIPGVGYTVTGIPAMHLANTTNGAYSTTISPRPNAPVTITPLKYGYTFSPASVTFDNVSGGNQVVNFTGTLDNPIDGSPTFVRQHYLDFLGREPDADGLNFWTSQIEVCGPLAQCSEVRRINVSAAFYLSIEFQETGFLAYRMHKAAYGDIAGTPVPVRREEFLPDTQSLAQGVQVGVGNWQQQLDANKNAFADAFVNRPRFTALYSEGMSAAEFVDRLNANAGGALDAAERNALVDGLTSGAKTRGQVLRAVAEDADLARAEKNKAFVLMQYFGYLRRNPDDVGFNGQPDPNFDGYNFWLGRLNQFGGNFVQAEMVKAFIMSIEYRQRFGQ